MAGGILGGIVAETQSEEMAIFKALFPSKREQLLMLTEITPDLIINITTLEVLADRYNSTFLKSLAKKLYASLKSKDRQSSVELIEIALGSRRRALAEEGE